jgi:hypothetical protein
MWSILIDSDSFWEESISQQLFKSKKSSSLWKEMMKNERTQKFEIFRESDSEQIVVVLTEIVLTEIEKSNTIWDEIFSWWSRSRENEIFSERSRLRIVEYCQKSSIFSWHKDWVQIIDDLSESWRILLNEILTEWSRSTRFDTCQMIFLIRTKAITNETKTIRVKTIRIFRKFLWKIVYWTFFDEFLTILFSVFLCRSILFQITVFVIMILLILVRTIARSFFVFLRFAVIFSWRIWLKESSFETICVVSDSHWTEFLSIKTKTRLSLIKTMIITFFVRWWFSVIIFWRIWSEKSCIEF